jgi:hypothetical protein
MNTQTMMLAFLAIIVVAGMWQSRRMKSFVFCSYTSRSKQAYDKVVKEKNSYVIFEGKKFYLLPSFGKSRQFDKGLSAFFPTKITAYDFRWNSPYPVDPNTGEPAILSPEVEKALDQEGILLAAYQNQGQAGLSGTKGKGGMMEKMMPIILIGLTVAVAYLIYTNLQSSKNNKTTQNAIIDLYNTLNKNGITIIPVTPAK